MATPWILEPRRVSKSPKPLFKTYNAPNTLCPVTKIVYSQVKEIMYKIPQVVPQPQTSTRNVDVLHALAEKRTRTLRVEVRGRGTTENTKPSTIALTSPMNELDLIREVEKRPILYDKTISGFNKTKLRDDAWKEVENVLHVSESECKKRWRSLRDSFIKLQRTHGGKTRWPYHYAMRFLLPHVDPNCAKQVAVKTEEQEQIKREPLYAKMEREQQQTTDDSDQDEERLPLRSLPDLSFAVEPARSAQLSGEEEEDSQSSNAKKMRMNSTEEEYGGCQQCNRTDPDELFLLSCASTLKRLNSKQNAVARLKIQQVLYEAEFGVTELPFVTPASDCGYELLENGVDTGE